MSYTNQPEKLPYELFLKTFEYVPRLAVCLVFENDEGEVLLTKRSIPPQENCWHYPGGFLLKNESIESCIKRIIASELGITDENYEMQLAGVFEDSKKDPRGHVVDVMYKTKLNTSMALHGTSESKECRFFKKLPKNIGFNHRETLRKLGYA